MILSDADIRRRLADGELVVEPLADPELQVQPEVDARRLNLQLGVVERLDDQLAVRQPAADVRIGEYHTPTGGRQGLKCPR